MGGEMFCNKASAKTAEEAFKSLVDKALYEYGHRGYTGTIAEKSGLGFKMETPRDGESPMACVERCHGDENHFSDDKWGPAACVDAGPDPKNPELHVFVFFGWASS